MIVSILTPQQQRQFKVIRKPHASEKSSFVAEKYRQFVFKVQSDANKFEVKQAVESLFGVKVDVVRLLNVKPQYRRFKQIKGRLKAWKKAYVSLKAGYDIDFTGIK
jgi:large subunit ribosomal protein L23